MKKSKSIKASRAVDAAITYVILIAVAVFFFFPCLWLILASFSDSGSLYTLKGFFPEAFSFRNYQNLFTDTQMYNYPEWFGNTLFVAGFSPKRSASATIKICSPIRRCITTPNGSGTPCS